MIKAHVYITLKQGVLDPQGQATQNALAHLGLDTIQGVRQGKFIELTLNTDDEKQARKLVEKACEDLLANTVIENYRFELVD